MQCPAYSCSQFQKHVLKARSVSPASIFTGPHTWQFRQYQRIGIPPFHNLHAQIVSNHAIIIWSHKFCGSAELTYLRFRSSRFDLSNGVLRLSRRPFSACIRRPFRRTDLAVRIHLHHRRQRLLRRPTASENCCRSPFRAWWS